MGGKRQKVITLDQNESFIQLMKWMKTNGFRSNKCLRPAVFKETGRGIMASRIINPGQLLIEIPEKLLITTSTVFNSDLGHFIKQWSLKFSALQVLALFLIWEKWKKEDSRWHAYINVLPSEYCNPAGYLKNIFILPLEIKEEVKTRLKIVHQAYNEIRPFLFFLCKQGFVFLKDESATSFESFLWGWSTVNTRAVYFDQEPNRYLNLTQPDHYALAPFLDLFNHSPNAKVKAGFNTVTRCYEISSLEGYSKYSQVFIDYGAHDNITLYLEYGFIVPENPHSVVHLNIGDILKELYKLAKNSDRCSKIREKMMILESRNLLRNITCNRDGLSWCLQIGVIILCLSDDELLLWQRVLENATEFKEAYLLAAEICKNVIQTKLKNQLSLQDARINKNCTTEEFSIATSLWKEEARILEATLIFIAKSVSNL